MQGQSEQGWDLLVVGAWGKREARMKMRVGWAGLVGEGLLPPEVTWD
jgi:hypothetical protein